MSTFVATLLTFCPPGPDERTARHSTAASGTRMPLAIRIGSAMDRP